jgi:hypothetical protein
VIKLEVCALFAARKNGGRRNGEGGEREESHLSGHKLITNEFIDEFKFIDNFVYKNNTSLYFLTFFFILSFPILIPSVYINFIGVYIIYIIL